MAQHRRDDGRGDSRIFEIENIIGRQIEGIRGAFKGTGHVPFLRHSGQNRSSFAGSSLAQL